MRVLEETFQARERIGRCLAGDVDALEEFQRLYGELIYGFPVRAFRLTPDEAGDFYVWAFDRGRLFRRLRSYAGRAPFRAYLLGCVLEHMLVDWMRQRRSLETVSLDDVGDIPDARFVPGNAAPPDEGPRSLEAALGGVEPERAIVMKLLHIEDCELSPADVRIIAGRSGRSVADVLRSIENLRATVRKRESDRTEVEQSLDGVQSWIRAYERRLADIDRELAVASLAGRRRQRLQQEAAELRRKLIWRRRQRERLLQRVRRRKTTAPYAAIAEILGTSVGNVGSQIARLRRELEARAGGETG